jgi:predicted lipoprotein with Yx(FWY)xxD motif
MPASATQAARRPTRAARRPATQAARRRATRAVPAALVLGGVALVAAACGSSGSGTPAGAAGANSAGGYGAPASTPAAAAPASAAEITTHATSLGTVLAGPEGHTVYLFEKDMGGQSTCSGACATVWPPVTTSGSPMATGSAQQMLLSTTSRSDGSKQVTYAGHPLYTFAGDSSATDVRGEGLQNFGGGWYVLTPSGQKVDRDAS